MSTPIQAGSTDQRLRCVAVQDDYSTFKTDLVIADIQSLVVKRSGAADVTVTANALDTNPDDAHTDGNIYNAGAGEYLVSVPDAAVASGAPSVKIYGTWTDGADSGYLIGDEYPLVSYDWQSSERSLTTAAISEIQTGLATSANQTTILNQTLMNFEILSVKYVVRDSEDKSIFVRPFSNSGYVGGLTHEDVTITIRRFLDGKLVDQTSLTPVNLSSLQDNHTDGGFIEDTTSKKYRVDLPDTAIATGEDLANKIELKVEASGVVGNTSEEIILVDTLPWDVAGPTESLTTISLGVPDMKWWITLDENGTNTISSGSTDETGNISVLLIPDNYYYLWARKVGYDDILGQKFLAVPD